MWTRGELIIILPIVVLTIISFLAIKVYYDRHPEKNKIVPFMYVTIILLTCEIVKQLWSFFAIHPYDTFYLPFTVCASNLIWYSLISFSKKDSKKYQLGCCGAYIINILVTLLIFFQPSSVALVKDDGNFMFSIQYFNGIIFHYLEMFACLWLLYWMPYKIRWKDIFKTTGLAAVLLTFFALMGFAFDQNYGGMRGGFVLSLFGARDLDGTVIGSVLTVGFCIFGCAFFFSLLRLLQLKIYRFLNRPIPKIKWKFKAQKSHTHSGKKPE
ncbi:MAG: YwaF family protein [Mycoplasmataceae bacterium]|nr:YwaF family protein [Mycoplasmataceae bacterium]